MSKAVYSRFSSFINVNDTNYCCKLVTYIKKRTARLLQKKIVNAEF